MKPNEKLEAVFFRSGTGTEPVRDWLKGLRPDQRKAIGEDICTAQYGWPLGMPLIRKLEPGLWEVRTTLSGGNIARTFFTVDSRLIVLLHGFIKKSQKTPQKELKTARRRLKKYLEAS